MARAAADPVVTRVRTMFADLGEELLQVVRTESGKAERLDAADRLLTVDEATEYLRVSRQRVYRFINAGELEPIKFGRNTRLRMSDVQRLMEGTAA